MFFSICQGCQIFFFDLLGLPDVFSRFARVARCFFDLPGLPDVFYWLGEPNTALTTAEVALRVFSQSTFVHWEKIVLLKKTPICYWLYIFLCLLQRSEKCFIVTHPLRANYL
jgi:hypothetical protein